jgi:hypothetical protein
MDLGSWILDLLTNLLDLVNPIPLSSLSLSIAHQSMLPPLYQASEFDKCRLIDQLSQIISLLVVSQNWVDQDFPLSDIIVEVVQFYQ